MTFLYMNVGTTKRFSERFGLKHLPFKNLKGQVLKTKTFRKSWWKPHVYHCFTLYTHKGLL